MELGDAPDVTTSRPPQRWGEGYTLEQLGMSPASIKSRDLPKFVAALQEYARWQAAQVEALSTALQTAQEQMAAEHAARQLAQADLINFRRRTEQQRPTVVMEAQLKVVGQLLAPYDSLMLALEHAGGDANSQLREGILTVLQQMRSALATAGLTEIATEGEEFDPNLHLAIQVKPNPAMAGKVAKQVQSGWQFGDRVVRAASVVVYGE